MNAALFFIDFLHDFIRQAHHAGAAHKVKVNVHALVAAVHGNNLSRKILERTVKNDDSVAFVKGYAQNFYGASKAKNGRNDVQVILHERLDVLIRGQKANEALALFKRFQLNRLSFVSLKKNISWKKRFKIFLAVLKPHLLFKKMQGAAKRSLRLKHRLHALLVFFFHT